ncbi:MAG: cysteine desulfurase [Saprospiraceae bacterium]|nr:cysteine desulfurase [Saprospiraceae bacterium]
MNHVYLDNAATTPLHPEVIEAMTEAMKSCYGNPSSIHAMGRQSRALIEGARKEVAGYLNASLGEVFFTSGGTEATNMALKCAVRDLGVRRIVTSPIEHHCVSHTIQRLIKTDDVDLQLVKVDQYGRPDLSHLNQILAGGDAKTLVSLMHANNEIGVLSDMQKISEACRTHGALFHSDTVQTFGHFPFDLQDTSIDFLTGSAHKFHGPKGIGILYINGDVSVDAFMDGGSQERNMRAGTENLAGIVGLSTALKLSIASMAETHDRLRGLQRKLMSGLTGIDDRIVFHGDPTGESLYTVLNVGFPACEETEMMLLNLDIEGVCASGGSACSSGVDVGSHVIAHLYPDFSGTAIRFSFGAQSSEEDVEFLLQKVHKILQPS